jgi:hypothetical protein
MRYVDKDGRKLKLTTTSASVIENVAKIAATDGGNTALQGIIIFYFFGFHFDCKNNKLFLYHYLLSECSEFDHSLQSVVAAIKQQQKRVINYGGWW